MSLIGRTKQGPLLPLSDRRVKIDVIRVGTTLYGLPLYQFRYISGPERFEGVMAQDVLAIMPHEVVTGDDGLYRVNYERLGLTISRVDDALPAYQRMNMPVVSGWKEGLSLV